MPLITANGLELFYEASGNPSDPPVLLIAGLGVQLINWPDYFVEGLVESNHYVIRYDNRDIGLSTTFDKGAFQPQAVIEALLAGEDPGVSYTLEDMAADAVGLLDALGIGAAHLVGTSMGGMIAQTAAIRFPDRVLSLTSIMSTTGAQDVGQPTPEALDAIITPAPSTVRGEVIEHNLKSARIWASPGLFDEDRLRKLFEESWDRANGPQGTNTGRHLCAIIATGSRDEDLGRVEVPTLVVHGTHDTLITPDGGERTASLIRGSRLVLIDGMGHDLPTSFAARIVDAICELVAGTVAA